LSKSRFLASCFCLITSLSWLVTDKVSANEPSYSETVKIGFLSFRSQQYTQQRWQPLVDYLNQSIPQRKFELVVLYYPQMNQAFAERKIDYLFTNPQHFTQLNQKANFTPLATIMPLAEGIPVNQFGGVIFTRRDRGDINNLEDLSERTIAAPDSQSLGGYLMQKWELARSGEQVHRVEFTGMPHDQVVYRVLEGHADVGFVRTGVIEEMVRENKVEWQALKIINPDLNSSFPHVHSTALYPEWPFSAMPNTSRALNKQVAMALLSIQPQDKAAKSGRFYGFSPPGNYTPIESLMLKLDVLPRDDFSWHDVYQRYPNQVFIGLFTVIGITTLLFIIVVFSNLRLKRTSKERDQLNQSLQEINDNLENLVNVRTQALEETELRFRQMFERHASPMLLIDPETGEIIDANAAAAKFYGYNLPQIKAMNIYQINILPKEQVALERQLAVKEQRNYFVFPHQLANGEIRHVEVHSSPVTIDGKNRLFSIIHDVSERIKAEERLQLHDTALDYAANAIAITDQNAMIIWANKAYSALTGYQSDEVIGQSLYHPDHANENDRQLYQQIQSIVRKGEVWHGILHQTHKNGDRYYEEVTITPVRDKERNIRNFVAVLQDITERRDAEQQIQNLAFFDALTNLPNRRLLIDRLETVMAQTQRHHSHGALIFLDLDHFKILNDSHGHQVGDKLLQEASGRIKDCLRTGDTVARFGGDEFVILLTELDDNAVKAAQQANHVAEKVRKELSRPFFLALNESGATLEHSTSASMGITVFQDHEKPIDDLLKWTDMAMYQAKASGRNEIRLFDPKMQTQLDERASLEQDLRKAIEHEQLELYYQPQVDSKGRILGTEALLRWHHPERGMVSPAQFIPLAEETGLILPIGNWVLENACRQLAEWRNDPKLCLIQLAVNISAKQLRQSNFVQQVKDLIDQYQVNPLMLKFELTESVLLSHKQDSIKKMNALRVLGIQFSMDDFGTGYSSLSYLKQLPISQIKIDKSFIQDLGKDQMDEVMVQAIMNLGQSFQMSVLAEGVETDAQFEILQSYKCQFYQGYLFSHPLTLDDFKRKVMAQ
jgi:diguanylate cyclase (GGDEF)-like protein/PAS domain S-box-containing protein